MRTNKAEIKPFTGMNRSTLVESIFRRPGLSGKRRVYCAIAALQAISEWRDLTRLLDTTIHGEADVRPAYEILLQGYLFCGYPRAIESFYCLNEVLTAKGLFLPSDMPIPQVDAQKAQIRGKILAGQINKDKFPKIYDKITSLSPDLGYLMLVEGYGNILCRSGMDIKARELAVVSSLSASGAIRQLNSHIRGALNVGCSKTEVREAILTGLPWIGKRKVCKSLSIWSEISNLSIPDLKKL
jgi:4-carboxymuconolactone decarboxylase